MIEFSRTEAAYQKACAALDLREANLRIRQQREAIEKCGAKIESNAKVIAALREALKDNLELLDRATSGYIGGCRLDMDWNKSRDEVIEETKLLLATFEQNVEKSK